MGYLLPLFINGGERMGGETIEGRGEKGRIGKGRGAFVLSPRMKKSAPMHVHTCYVMLNL